MSAKTRFLQMGIVLTILIFSLVPVISAQGVQKNEPFIFTKADLSLLEQCDLLDQKFEKEGVVYTDAALNTYLDRVGKSLLPAGDQLERVQWRFQVLRDPSENAFALPNGSIYLHSGILSLLENESQLAAVMAHEMVHVLNRHAQQEHRSIRKKALAYPEPSSG